MSDSDYHSTRRQRLISRPTCSALLGMGMGLCLSLLLIAVGGFIYFQQANFILPGVSVGQVSLAGLTAEEAEQALATAWEASPLPIRLVAGSRSWPSATRELGLIIDARSTALRALDVGRGVDSPAIFSTLLEGTSVKPVVVLDPAIARQSLRQRAADIDLPPQDAAFHLEGGQVVTTPAQPGQRLEVEATVARLVADPALIAQNGFLLLVTTPVAPAITDVSAQVAQVNQLLATPLKINLYDPVTDEWLERTPAPEQVVSWLSVQPGNESAVVTIAPVKMAAYLTDLSATLGEGRFIAAPEAADQLASNFGSGQAPTILIRHSPTSYIVQAGDNLTRISWQVGMPYWRILQANPGLEANGLFAGQTLTIPSKDDLLPLPVSLNKRIVVSIGQQRLWTYENRQQLHEYVISTGIDRSPTQPGVFQVQTHELNAYASVWDLWMPHFLGVYEAWPGFMNGFHGLPLLSNGTRLWANILGRPASFGCIILNLAEAEELYTWAENGVVVEIRQ